MEIFKREKEPANQAGKKLGEYGVSEAKRKKEGRAKCQILVRGRVNFHTIHKKVLFSDEMTYLRMYTLLCND